MYYDPSGYSKVFCLKDGFSNVNVYSRQLRMDLHYFSNNKKLTKNQKAINQIEAFKHNRKKANRNVLPTNNSQINHIFRNKEGHLLDTPKNRQSLIRVSNNMKNFLGTDARGNSWYSKISQDTTQTWVETRRGTIRNGGINTRIKDFDLMTGLKQNLNRK
jgi:hypothetical protein